MLRTRRRMYALGAAVGGRWRKYGGNAAVIREDVSRVRRRSWSDGLSRPHGVPPSQELLHKLEHAQWRAVVQRNEVTGYASQSPTISIPAQPGQAASSQSLEFCVKAETTVPLSPAHVAAAYMDTASRQQWHSACTDSAMVEELWCASTRTRHVW